MRIGWLAIPALLAAVAAPAQPARRSVWDGVYTEEQSGRGAAIYEEHCARCHGPTLAGGEAAGPLAGPSFVANWNGLPLGDLLERMRTTMPQDRPGALSRQQNADVLAYLLNANRMPAGETELARRTEALALIVFEAQRRSGS